MKTRKLRLLSALLALAMMLALLPTAAFAETSGDYEYKIDSDGNVTITKYIGSGGDVVIPEELEGHPVTIIGQNAFFECTGLTSVVIPSNVMKVEANAFTWCENLTSVTFGVGFEYNRLVPNIFVYRMELVDSEWKRTFYWDIDITNAENMNALLAMGFALYDGDGQLGDIHPLSEKSITITFDDNNGNNSDTQTLSAGQTIDESEHKPAREGYDFAGWYVDKACTKKFDFTKPLINDMTLYAKWTAGGDCGAEGDNVTWQLDSDGTLTISGTGAMADYADNLSTYKTTAPWAEKQVKRVIINEGVTRIGNEAFFGLSSIISASIPNGVESIGKYAFSGWYSGGSPAPQIEEIEIPVSVTDIGEYAFSNCKNLKTVTLKTDSKLVRIGEYAFSNCPMLSKVMIPASVINIEEHAFYMCSGLQSVTFSPNSQLETIGDGVFNACPALNAIYCESALKEKLSGVIDKSKIGITHWNVSFVTDDNTTTKLVENNKTVDKPTTAPTKDGYIFAGWYTKNADGTWATEPFDFNTPITDDMTLYARWATEWAPITPVTQLYPITIDYGTAYDAEGNPIEKAAAGETVYLEANETAFDGMVFEYWKDHNGNVTLVNDHTTKTSFEMPEGEVHLEAMYKAADNDDTSWDAATVVTGVAIGTGTAILAYHIGTELYAEQVLGKDVAVPRTRADVALLAWQLAGSPAVELNGEPLSEAAQAEKWAVESGLMQLDAEGNFNGAKKMGKLKALRTLEKAKHA